MDNLNYSQLLNPISEAVVTGVNIREHDNEQLALYEDLKNLRMSLLKDERKKIEDTQNVHIDEENWQTIFNHAVDILTNYSKDLEISIWILEASVRIQGFAGLPKGLQLIIQLFDKYGANLHPQAHDKDSEYFDLQIALITSLSGKYEMGSLVIPFYFIDLILTDDDKSYNLWSLKNMLAEVNSSQASFKVTKEFILQSEKIRNIISGINLDVLSTITNAISESNNNFKILVQIIIKYFGVQAPDLSNLVNILSYCSSVITSINTIIAEKNSQISTEAAENIQDQHLEENKNDNSTILNNSKMSKDLAIKNLELIIKFFRETEPHSPVSYVLERGLRWSNLSLPEILPEVMSDKARIGFCKVANIPYLSEEEELSEENEE
jgi:type VI secretion system protein ImpA